MATCVGRRRRVSMKPVGLAAGFIPAAPCPGFSRGDDSGSSAAAAANATNEKTCRGVGRELKVDVGRVGAAENAADRGSGGKSQPESGADQAHAARPVFRAL